MNSRMALAMLLLAPYAALCAASSSAQTGEEGLEVGSGSGEAIELFPYGEEETERLNTVDEELINYSELWLHCQANSMMCYEYRIAE